MGCTDFCGHEFPLQGMVGIHLHFILSSACPNFFRPLAHSGLCLSISGWVQISAVEENMLHSVCVHWPCSEIHFMNIKLFVVDLLMNLLPLIYRLFFILFGKKIVDEIELLNISFN